jgi:O-antigen/teichoic acid export membrane protein
LLGVAAAWLGQNVILWVLGHVIVRRRVPKIARSRGSFQLLLARAFAAPSLRWAGMNAGAVLILATGPIIVAREAGAAAVPAFVAIRQLGEALYILAILPSQASEPFVSMLWSAGRRDALVELFRRNARYVMSAMLAGAAVVLVFGGDVASVWVGPENYAGLASLVLVTTFFTLECHHVMHSITLMATGRIPFLAPATISGLLTVALGVLFTHRYGVTGMFAAMVVSQLLTNNWFAPWVTLRQLAVPVRAYFRWLSPPLLLATTALLGAVAIRSVVATFVGTQTLGGLLLALALTATLSGAAAWYIVLSDTERQWLARRIQALGTGRA